jgi:DDE family transposase
MSFSSLHPRAVQFDQAFAPFLNDPGLPFANVLPAAEVEQALVDAGVTFGTSKRSVFTPALTLWAFLSQVVDSTKSCSAAVLRVSILLGTLGSNSCSSNTSAYCRARAKLPAVVIRKLALQVGRRLEDELAEDWLWHGRHVVLVDGTTVTLADTEDNQKAFPQSRSQKPGLGFPMIRMVLLLSLASAAVTGMAYGPYRGKETGETALLRQLLDDMTAGSILLADRYYCSYWMVAMAQQRQLDVVFRLHQLRKFNFSLGWQHGPDDHTVVWAKPKRPQWMDEATYAALPETLFLREVRYQVTTPGFRVRKMIIATTLLNAHDYSKEALADLYRNRWHVELDIRAIKQSLQMDSLRCHTPFMVEKEIWAHLLGYNLLRKVAAQAAQQRGVHPREVSFTATKDAVSAAWLLWTFADPAGRVLQGRQLLAMVGRARVGHRPDRIEPRAKKRRAKSYPLLTRPRKEAQAELLAAATAD